MTPAALTITADDQSKVYGAALPALTASYSGFVNGDTVDDLTTPPSVTTTATDTSPVSGSPYTITAGGQPPRLFHQLRQRRADGKPRQHDHPVDAVGQRPGTDSGSDLHGPVLPVSSGAGTPTGTVAFYNGSTVIDSPATLSGGVASLTVAAGNFGVGSYPITAKYSGDGNFNISDSVNQTLVVSNPESLPGP